MTTPAMIVACEKGAEFLDGLPGVLDSHADS